MAKLADVQNVVRRKSGLVFFPTVLVAVFHLSSYYILIVEAIKPYTYHQYNAINTHASLNSWLVYIICGPALLRQVPVLLRLLSTLLSVSPFPILHRLLDSTLAMPHVSRADSTSAQKYAKPPA